MDTKRSSMASGLGGWASFVDFSALFLKASAAGVAVSFVLGGGVVLLAALVG